MRKIIIFIGLLSCYVGTAQKLNMHYLEDQLYARITYNTLVDLPKGLSQNGFSKGIAIGFIKDIPINVQRNFGFGIGLGYAKNTYYQNLIISENNGTTNFSFINEPFKSNKFSSQLIEMPFEVRWRTSTATKYEFWRIYAGFKVGYLLTFKSKLRQNSGVLKTKNITEFSKYHYGLTLAIGYRTWNFYGYYGLNTLFKKNLFLNDKHRLKEFNLGLQFYIL